MRQIKRLVIGLFGLLLAQTAHAAPDLKAMHGVWSGTIGNLPVQACYNASDYTNDGRYFYLNRLSTIPLISDTKKPGELTEGWPDQKKVARWRIGSITANGVEGAWTGNGRTLPIRLTRMRFAVSEDSDSPCGSLAFVQPIIAATRIVKRPGRVHGLAVEKWKLATPDESVSIESFQLRGTGPAIAAINQRLRESFDHSEEGWKWCLRNAGAWGGSYYDEVETRLLTAHWLSVMSHNENSCGGAHPNNSNQSILFDRQSGRQVDVYTWFGSAAPKREQVDGTSETIDEPTGKLFDLIMKLHPRTGEKDKECGDAVATASSWALELKADGVSFTPELPRVVMACGDEVVLPWAKLRPFLNSVGKREVAALLAERRQQRSPVAKAR